MCEKALDTDGGCNLLMHGVLRAIVEEEDKGQACIHAFRFLIISPEPSLVHTSQVMNSEQPVAYPNWSSIPFCFISYISGIHVSFS